MVSKSNTADESKKLNRFQIYERDPAYEPSMQMESMVELDNIDDIGIPEPALSFSDYRKQQATRASNLQPIQQKNSHAANQKEALPVSNSKLVQSRTLNQSLVSRESKDMPTIEQSNPRLIDETFKQLQKGIITQEQAEDVEDSQSNLGANRIHTEKRDDTVGGDAADENIEPTIGNDESNSSITNNKDKNRRNIQTGPGQLTALITQTVITDHEPLTNRIYSNEREVRLDLSNQAIEEFPFWEIDQKQPISINLASNSICEWPAQPRVQKCHQLQELNVSQNYLNRIPGYIVSSYSRLRQLNLRNNQIATVPTLSRRCSILRHLEVLDLGQNRLQIFPTSFVMSIGHGDSTSNRTDRNNDAMTQNSSSQQVSGSFTDDTAATYRQNRLKALYLDQNYLEVVPAEIADHESLQTLHLQNNRLESMPASIFMIQGLRHGQLGLEWFQYVDPPLKCPFPPSNAPSDTMQVFMDLALQMCEESEQICETGQVKFIQFIEYFSQKQNDQGGLGGLLSDQIMASATSLGAFNSQLAGVGPTDTHELNERLIKQAARTERYLQQAANFGHVGVIKSLLGSPEAQKVYKEAKFRLSQRKKEFGFTTDRSEKPFTSTAEEFSALAISMLEHQTQASKALIEVGADFSDGFGTFGSALHLAAVQANPEVLELILQRASQNVDIRNAKYETPLHVVIQKLSTASTHLEMIGLKNRVSRANLLLNPRARVAAKMKDADPMQTQVELRLRAIGECLIFAEADLTAPEQYMWSYVHIASKSFSSATISWMLAINKVLKENKMEVFDFEQPGGSKNWTPLHVACHTGSFDVIRELIERANVDIFSRSLDNKLPRQMARNTIVAKVLRIVEKKVIQVQLGFQKPSSKRSARAEKRPSEQKPSSKLMIAQQKDWSRHTYRVGEDTLLYQQLMDQEPDQYAMEKSKRAGAGQAALSAQKKTHSLSQVLSRTKASAGSTAAAEVVVGLSKRGQDHAQVSSIQVDRQKYVSLSSTLRKCKLMERKKDIKYEQQMLLKPNRHLQEPIKTMREVKDRELRELPDDIDNRSNISVSSACFSEEILGESMLMRHH